MALPIPPGPNQPIPNNPFYAPPTNRLEGGDQGVVTIGVGLTVTPEGVLNATGLGPIAAVTYLAAGTGLAVDNNTGNVLITNTGVVTLSAGPGIAISGSNGNFTVTNTLPAIPTSGTVYQVDTGVGLTGGPITGSGTIALTNTGVGPGTYTNPTITVDAQGRITFATPGSPGSLISGTYPIQVAGGILVSIADATTGNPGAVQLENSTNSTSLTRAATANSVKVAYDAAQAAGSSSTAALAAANAAQLSANNAQDTANQAVIDAATAQSTANSALPKAGGTMTGPIVFAPGQTFPGTAVGDATVSSKGVVQIGANIQVSSGVISVLNSSTTQSGLVQLNDTTNSTSTTQALTANAGSILQQQINALSVSSNLTLAGTIDASTGFMVTVTTEGAANGFVVGSPLPTAAPANDDYFAIITVAGTMTPPGGAAQVCHVGDWWLSNGAVWQFLDIAAPAPVVPSATPTTEGLVYGLTDATSTYNTALGSSALNTTSTGIGNTALGAVAGTLLGAATGATYVGAGAGCSADTTDFAVGVGFQALGSLTTGCANIGIGCLSGIALTTECGNVILGSHPGFVGCNNQLILASGTGTLRAIVNECGALSFDAISYGTGGQALLSNGATSAPTWQTLPVTGPASPVALGTVLGCTVNDVAYLGCFAGYAYSGCGTVAIGCQALSTGTGCDNVAIGTQAILCNVSGEGNVAIGACALCETTTGSYNTAIGPFAGYSNPTGSYNIHIGLVSGGNNPGDCNVTIGNYTHPPTTGGCQLAIGNGNATCWLTGDSTYAIKPGAGIIDCADSCGTAGQVLMSNGSNRICWGTAAGAPVATPVVRGTVYGCSGGNNTSVGCNALKSLTAGGSNTAFGLDALCSVTISTSNTAMGDSALSLSTGCQNTAVGAAAIYQNASGTCNSSFGHHSMVFSSGSCNSAFGLCSLRSVSGSSNVALGANTGSLLTSGNSNVLVGPSVQAASATGSCQLAIGFDNGQNWLTGDSTKAIKPGAGLIDCANSCGTAGQVLMSTGSNSVCWGSAGGGTPVATPTAVGTLFGCSNSAGTLATAVGYNALLCNPTGNWNVAVGSGAGQFLTTGQWNTFIGSFAGNIATTATGSVAIGINAAQLSNGSGSVAIGNSAGYRSGNDNVTIGNASMSSTCTCTTRTVAIGSSTARFGSGNDNVTIGFGAACVPSCGGCNTVIGSGALQGIGTTATTAPCNTSLGFKTLNAATTACLNVALGFAAGCSITSGAQNVLIGPNVGANCTTEACTLAIGYSNTALWLTGDSTKAIKPGAGIIDCAGSCGTAGQVLMSNGLNAVCWGTAGGGGGSPATPTVAGTVFGCTVTTACSTTLLGYNAGCALTSGTTNTFIGRNAGLSATTLNCSVLIGNNAGDSITAGQCAIIIGHNSGCSLTTAYGDHISIGTEAMATGTGISNIVIGNGAAYVSGTSDSMVIIGHCAGEQGGSANTLIGYESNRNPFGTTTGFRNTAVGYQTLFNASSGAQNTAIGFRAGESLTTGSNNIILGNTASTAAVTSSNSVTLGNASISVIRAQVTTITGLSDARDKTNITALPVGLDFINSLNPVKFTWQMREPNEVKDGTSEAGFIAQDLQTAQEAAGADYLNLVYDENPDKLEASAGKLIPVLVKAIQELSAKVEALEAKLEGNG